MDVGRYDSMDGGGRAAPGAAAESNAGSSCRELAVEMPGAAECGGCWEGLWKNLSDYKQTIICYFINLGREKVKSLLLKLLIA
jgi:hypothetical protein